MLIESVRLYAICKAMKFTHLPVPGGLYDQHPRLLDDWMVIMSIEGEVQARKQAEREHNAKKPMRANYRG